MVKGKATEITSTYNATISENSNIFFSFLLGFGGSAEPPPLQTFSIVPMCALVLLKQICKVYFVVLVRMPPPLMQRGRLGCGLRPQLTLAECGHNHAGNLSHAPPHKHKADAEGYGVGEDFDNSRHRNLCRNCVNDALERRTGNSSRTAACQTFSFPLK